MSDNKKKDANPGIKEQQRRYDIPERFEIIGGIRYDFLSSPKVPHQHIVGNLFAMLHTSCRKRGIVFVAPMDVHFDDGDNVAQPDILFIAEENRAIIRDGFVYGAPDLVVEVLSESTGRRDKTLKKAMYERFGVQEYWVADPVYRTVDQHMLTDGKYQLVSTLTEEDVLKSPLFACMEFDLSEVFPPEEEG